MSDWIPVARVGTPEVRPGQFKAESVDITIGTRPTAPSEWKPHFRAKLLELGYEAQFNYRHSDDGEGMHVIAPEKTFERAVEAVDEAIAYANQQYELVDLPFEMEARQHEADLDAAQARRIASLSERALKLEKPGEPLWTQYHCERA